MHLIVFRHFIVQNLGAADQVRSAFDQTRVTFLLFTFMGST